MKLWGGIECTLNRVGNRRSDQLAQCGHYARGSDLEKIAALGIRTLRYPLLWERAVTGSPIEFDWRFADERLTLLQRHDITPIAGLVHHGSGPDGISMFTKQFADGLAEYAGALARRFPWLEYYTPVNEPLTTARFCGLYGHWYPHACSDRAFTRILLNECRATVLAMRAIRRVNPQAKLVQTDDLGHYLQHGPPRVPGGVRESPPLAGLGSASAVWWTTPIRCIGTCAAAAPKTANSPGSATILVRRSSSVSITT